MMTPLARVQDLCSTMWRQSVELTTVIEDVGRRLLIAQDLEDAYHIRLDDLKVTEAATVGAICAVAEVEIAAVHAAVQVEDDDSDDE